MTTRSDMTSLKPHWLRAVYDWILENELTPHILVDATLWGVSVPEQHIKAGQMVLNIEPRAVRNFVLNSDKMTFDARFDGKTCKVIVPIKAVLSIFAQENGCGRWFSDQDDTLSTVGPRLAGHRPSHVSAVSEVPLEQAEKQASVPAASKKTRRWFGRKDKGKASDVNTPDHLDTKGIENVEDTQGTDNSQGKTPLDNKQDKPKKPNLRLLD